MPATVKKKGVRERLSWLSWQYFFALICFALGIAAFVVSLISGPVPWYYFVVPLIFGTILALAGRRARKVKGQAEVPLPTGAPATVQVDTEFGDQQEEGRA